MTDVTPAQLRGWDGPWAGLRVVVLGLGLTGFSAADTLAELNCRVVVVDGTSTDKKEQDAATLRLVGVEDIRFGPESLSGLPMVGEQPPELILTSPGWRPDSPLMRQAQEQKIPVWSDIELARRLGARPGAREPKWLALTGTNGKTTTVTLLEAMLRAQGRRAVACGNIGMPVLDAIRDPQGYDALALELSSFQLHYTHTLNPLAAAVLNIAEDHVDWHGSMAEYIADKAKIYQGAEVACVYNAADPVTEQMVAGADVAEGCRAIAFTTDTPEVSMLGLVRGEDGNDILVDRAFLENRRHQALELAQRSDFAAMAPKHLIANALAAAALARAAGVEPEAVRAAISTYEAGDHRIQPVAKAADILWVNDSKATNPHAAAASLSSFTDVVWIAGGLPKGVNYDQLIQEAATRLRQVILIGTDSSQLRTSLERHAPHVPVIGGTVRHDEFQTTVSPAAEESTEDLLRSADGILAIRAAVTLAHRVAKAGQTVLLSPAAASMDQFSSYAERGQAFIEAVAELMEESA